MTLPFRENAIVPQNKIQHYFLNFSHPAGQSKARYFEAFGFNETNMHEFEIALLNIGRYDEIITMVRNDFGSKYIIEGRLRTPDRRNPRIITVWIIENGSKIPKLVTAYPK